MTPKLVFDCFAEINKVPRPSKHEEKMIAWLQDFGREHGLLTLTDPVGNVLIRKPATPGMEHRPGVVLQSHMDMVCEPSDGSFDFLTQPIETVVEGEWLRAKGTTLGADDGIGMAMQLAVLIDPEVKHGPLECLFTRDEETGLTGAMGMEPGFMTGQQLINLDSEDEGQIFVSCAGGARTEAWFDYEPETLESGQWYTFRVGVRGLTGGHSGDDINKLRANANKLLVRFLCTEMERRDVRLLDIQSGGLHNAIPREGWAVCAVPWQEKENVRLELNLLAADVQEEYSRTEPALEFTLESEPLEGTFQAMPAQTGRRMVLALQAVCNGVFAMSQDIDGLVETSSNLASIRREGQGCVKVCSSQRSSVLSARENVCQSVRAAYQLAGARVETGEGYPGWKMNPQSQLLAKAKESYVRLFGQEPKILAIHAGLECGLFSEKYPGLDMISVGPTLRGVHSPDEKLHIPSVQKVWDFLLDVLRNV